jgi:hypothetical protein
MTQGLNYLLLERPLVINALVKAVKVAGGTATKRPSLDVTNVVGSQIPVDVDGGDLPARRRERECEESGGGEGDMQ